jgi:hypothetical protein
LGVVGSASHFAGSPLIKVTNNYLVFAQGRQMVT